MSLSLCRNGIRTRTFFMIDLPSCGVLAAGGVRVPWAEIPELRKNFGSHRGQALAPLLRQSDEQTVLALAAVMHAVEGAGWRDRSFANWGVVASGRSFGRGRFDAALDRYRRLSTRGASPLIVPHLSLHALSGTLSIALGMHGPNYGVSGQADHLGETLLAGLGLIEREDVEGLWVVACDLDPEQTLDAGGEAGDDLVGQAAALAISRDVGGIELTLGPGIQIGGRLSKLVDWLNAPALSPWRCGVAGVGVLDVCRIAPALRRAG